MRDIKIKGNADLAELLEAAREYKGMSKRQLAAEAELSSATYCVSIKNESIGTVTNLFKYLDALGLQMKIGPKA